MHGEGSYRTVLNVRTKAKEGRSGYKALYIHDDDDENYQGQGLEPINSGSYGKPKSFDTSCRSSFTLASITTMYVTER